MRGRPRPPLVVCANHLSELQYVWVDVAAVAAFIIADPMSAAGEVRTTLAVGALAAVALVVVAVNGLILHLPVLTAVAAGEATCRLLVLARWNLQRRRHLARV